MNSEQLDKNIIKPSVNHRLCYAEQYSVISPLNLRTEDKKGNDKKASQNNKE
jgi:hypothetical protein